MVLRYKCRCEDCYHLSIKYNNINAYYNYCSLINLFINDPYEERYCNHYEYYSNCHRLNGNNY